MKNIWEKDLLGWVPDWFVEIVYIFLIYFSFAVVVCLIIEGSY